MDSSKKEHAITLKLRGLTVTLPLILGIWIIMIYCEKIELLPRNVTYTVVMCFFSGIFHVTYSYVSTGLVLSQLSVVSHAVANIMKRVFVVLLLYAFGRRVASPYSFAGLAVCTTGLLLYAWDKRSKQSEYKSGTDSSSSSSSSSSSTEKLTGRLNKLWKFIILVPCLALSILSISHIDLHPQNLHSSDPDNSFADITFGVRSLEHPETWELEPILKDDLLNQSEQTISQFMQRRLINDPFSSSFLSKQLKTSFDVTKEAQRIHYNMFQDAIGKYKYTVLLDIASHENKGDPAITVGEIYFLSRMNITIVYYCNTFACTDENLNKAVSLARKYSPEELVVLIHGGGNINGYAEHDKLRFKLFKLFKGFQFFVFPQSIWLENATSPHFEVCRRVYCCNENLTIVLRDELSYFLAKKYFSGSSKLLMAPDMAFHIGPVKRFMSPVFDILWIKRNDVETPGYSTIPPHPSHLRLHVSDWHKFRTPKTGTSLEKSFYATVMGFFFVQRGRVIITDRIHGHILATLMDIPHVLLDNKVKKLSSYHNSWTRGVKNTRLTDNPREALRLALELLEEYKDEIPPRAVGIDISEHFKDINYSLPETNFP